MAKKHSDIRRTLRNMEFNAELLRRIDCTEDENKKYAEMMAKGNPLPDGVYSYVTDGVAINEFYTVQDPGLTEEEKRKFILLKQYEAIRTIKNCVVFFTALTALGILVSLLALS